jgi:hypothetical protein
MGAARHWVGGAEPDETAKLLQAVGVPASQAAVIGKATAVPFAVWPETWPVLQIADALATQLRVMGSRVAGFDYAALPAVLRLLGFRRAEWSELFAGLRVFEQEMVRVMGERHGRSQ